MVDEVLAVGAAGAGAEEYAEARRRRESGGTDPSRAARLAVYLASPACDGLTGRLISAAWDDWERLGAARANLAGTDVFTLRRIVPEDRGLEL